MSDGGTYEEEFGAMRREAYRAAFAVLHDTALADDAASDALVQVWLHWSDLAAASYRTAWIRRVAMNAAFHILRKRRRSEHMPMTAASDFEDAASARVSLATALLRLPRRQRETLALHYHADLTDVDIAAALGISVNSVKTHQRRGLDALRVVITAKEVERAASATP